MSRVRGREGEKNGGGERGAVEASLPASSRGAVARVVLVRAVRVRLLRCARLCAMMMRVWFVCVRVNSLGALKREERRFRRGGTEEPLLVLELFEPRRRRRLAAADAVAPLPPRPLPPYFPLTLALCAADSDKTPTTRETNPQPNKARVVRCLKGQQSFERAQERERGRRATDSPPDTRPPGFLSRFYTGAPLLSGRLREY